MDFYGYKPAARATECFKKINQKFQNTGFCASGFDLRKSWLFKNHVLILPITKSQKPFFLLSDNDYFLRLIFQNQDFGYYPKTSEFCSKYEHKFYARNPEITSDFDGRMPTEKNAPEKQYHKIDFADYQNFGSYSCN
ncbi:hypothetical protein [Ruminococcus difficilis]|uniref:hypothetical protein n=1 Tax=Ruminococcus difficilis TaxID=2763069 RepID=UPI001917576E|nr:hypothetical protein [Ruminococcus difficilis]